jgi:hypothetical protein
MKYLIIISLILLWVINVYAQSPQVTIDLRFEEEMYHGDTCSSVYKMTIDQYSFKSNLAPKDWFTNDTSQYDWGNINICDTKDFKVKRIANQTYNAYVFNYNYSQQDYVFENEFLFTVTREKCGLNDTMKFYFPIKISSFVTFIKLNPVYFKPGVYDFTNAVEYFISKNRHINVTLKRNLKMDEYKK